MDTANPGIPLRTLREAALLLGGERKLAEFLVIEVWLVSRWLEGLGYPPDFILLRCTELIESRQAAAVTGEQPKGFRSSP
jgi:hypothetical protein